MASRAFQIGGVLIQQDVQLGDQRAHLDWLIAADAFGPSGADLGQLGAQPRKGAQAQADLQHDAPQGGRPPKGEA